MKILLPFLFFVLFFSNVFSQSSGIVWEKELSTNTDTSNSGVIFQGITTDSLNNIYLCYSLNGSDTTSSIISKFSPYGELLWRRTLLSNNQYQGIYTQFDYRAKLFIDHDGNLVFCSKGYDSVTDNHLLLFKFDLNGNLVNNGGISIVENISTTLINEIQVSSLNGNIYFPIYEFNSDSSQLTLYCFDKNFNYLFNKKLKFYSSTHGALFGSNDIHIGILDSFMIVQSSNSVPDFTDIQCVSLYNDSIKFFHSENKFLNYTKFFSVDNKYILAGASGIAKFDDNGNKLFEHLGDTRNPSYDNGYINYTSVNFAGFFYIPVNSYYCRYNVFTDSIYSFLTTIPQTIAPISYSIERKGNFLYSSGFLEDDTIKNLNGIRTLFFSKMDTLGNLLDYYYSTINYAGWTQDGLTTCMDKDNNFIAIHCVRKPLDSTAVKIFNSILKGSFNRNPNLNGICYYDESNDCIKDSAEQVVSQNIIHLLPEDIYTTTDSNGKYSFTKLAGNATIEIIPMNSSALCDTAISIPCSDTLIYNSLNFAYKPSENIYCQASIHNFVARPGFYPRVYCYIKNTNFFTVHNVHVAITLDSTFQYNSSNTIFDSIIGNTFYLNIDSIGINGYKKLEIITYLPLSVPLGYGYTHTIQMESQKGANKCTIVDTTTGVVTGSYDPNDKKVEPFGKGPNHLVPNNSTLKYTIHFQNTGTDTAFNIRIFDNLDENLDINTFHIIAQSHSVNFKFENRKVIFYFNNIHLPDSNRDFNLSSGFIEYSIKPKDNIEGEKILNKADIYFDYNIPINTNTTSITIGNYLEPHVITPTDISLYPNPNSTGNLKIKIDVATQDIFTLFITDIYGRIVQRIITDKQLFEGTQVLEVNLKVIHAGLYFVNLKSSKSKKISKKLIFGY